MVLWPKPVVRPIRFHDLRHTTASLLMMAGANPAAVQRILRHSDPRITTEVYGHLAPGYLRAEVNRLAFGLPAPALPVTVEVPVAVGGSLLVTRLLPEGSPVNSKAGTPGMNPEESRPLDLARPRGFEPLAFGFVAGPPTSARTGTPMQAPAKTRNGSGAKRQKMHSGAAKWKVHATPLLHTPVTNGEQPPTGGGLMSVREVALRLGVCAATVYTLCAQGRLPHVRVLNAIRVTPNDLERFTETWKRGHP